MNSLMLIKVCALGVAFVAGLAAGQPVQVQATPKTLLAGPIETVSSLVKYSRESVSWKQGTYKVRYLTVEATGYAPLDPRAVKGMCYSGNLRITASGARTKPGITVAAPKHVPFGTKIMVHGHGLRVVEDRGGAIKGKRIDICFQSRAEAIKFGRRNIEIIVFEEGNND